VALADEVERPTTLRAAALARPTRERLPVAMRGPLSAWEFSRPRS
jgi:hypothetical protein